MKRIIAAACGPSRSGRLAVIAGLTALLVSGGFLATGRVAKTALASEAAEQSTVAQAQARSLVGIVPSGDTAGETQTLPGDGPLPVADDPKETRAVYVNAT